jgi:hypothetical protein
VPSLSASATGSSQPVDVSAETAATSDDLDGKAQHRPGARFRVPDQKGAGSYPTETGATHEYETPHSNADEKTAAGNDVGYGQELSLSFAFPYPPPSSLFSLLFSLFRQLLSSQMDLNGTFQSVPDITV